MTRPSIRTRTAPQRVGRATPGGNVRTQALAVNARTTGTWNTRRMTDSPPPNVNG